MEAYLSEILELRIDDDAAIGVRHVRLWVSYAGRAVQKSIYFAQCFAFGLANFYIYVIVLLSLASNN